MSELKKIKFIPPKAHKILYKNAIKAVKDIKLSENSFMFLDGSFVFGDFIEAFFVNKNLHTKELTISTLSLSENNIYSLRNLLEGGYVDKLNIIVSDYFYSHERQKAIKLMKSELKNTNIVVARIHTKIVIFKTDEGDNLVFEGSANLRSSGNLEQITVLKDKKVYNFIYNIHNKMCKGFEKKQKALTSLDFEPIFDLQEATF